MFPSVPFDQNPHNDVSEKAFYASSEDDSDKESHPEESEKPKKKPYIMDPDHRLLLRNTKPLLSSRNAAVSTLCYTSISKIQSEFCVTRISQYLQDFSDLSAFSISVSLVISILKFI